METLPGNLGMGNLLQWALSQPCAVISVIGPHGGKGPSEIIECKRRDIENVGRTFWAFCSRQAKPESIRRMSVGAPSPVFFIDPSISNGAKDIESSPVLSEFFDNKKWIPLPSGLSPVTGTPKSNALVLDALESNDGSTPLDLWQFADFPGGNVPIKIGYGGSTLCAVAKDMSNFSAEEKIKSPSRKIIAVGRLVAPYAVWLR